MTDNEIAFWCFGLPMSLLLWIATLALMVAILKNLWDVLCD